MNADQPDHTTPEPTAGSRPEHPQSGHTLPAGDGAPVDPRSEKEIWVGRTHWKHYFGTVFFFGLIIVLAWVLFGFDVYPESMGSSTALLVAAVVTVAVILLVVIILTLKIIGHRYRLTGQRLFIERGILSQTIDQTELIRVDDVRVKKSLLDRIFGLGTVEILSTDATDQSLLIEGVKKPDELAEHVRACMRTLRSRSLFVENL